MKKLLSIILTTIMLISVAVLPSNAALPPLQFGDLNYDGVSVVDATIIQLHLVGNYELRPTQIFAADVDADEELTILDATLIQKKLAGLVDEFPAGDECHIDLHFDALVADYNSSTATVGEYITFEALAHSYCEPLTYEFYINDDLVREKSADNTYKVRFTQTGFYEIKCVVTNKAGLESLEILDLLVNDPVESGWIVVNNIYHEGFYDWLTTFVACVDDGFGPYEYKFELYESIDNSMDDESLGTLIETRDYSDDNRFTTSSRLKDRTQYTLVLTVKNEVGMSVTEYFEYEFLTPPPA